MDIISREAVVDAIHKRDDRLQKCEIYRNKADRIDLLGVLPAIHTIPSAFEGMTAGEVIQALFPIEGIYREEYIEVVFKGQNHATFFTLDFWDAPYKVVSEDKK